MGTFTDSAIVKARTPKNCANGMTHAVPKGELYLRYKLGQRNDVAVCIKCAMTVRGHDPRSGCGILYYDCQALRDYMQGVKA